MNRDSALVRYAIGSGVGVLVTALLLLVDTRTLAGEALWLKPLKFFLSSAIYALTLEYGLAQVRGFESRLNGVRKVVAWGLSFEMLVICSQAARGVKSHFNFATPWDAAIFTAMGVVISVVVLAGFFGILHIVRARHVIVKARREALVLGFAIFTMAAFLGASMARPTPEQQQALSQSQASPIIGSHFVGAVEGEAKTMAFTGWNAQSGDLRVAHFLGMHIIHLLLGLTLLMQWRGMDENSSQSVLLIRVSAALGLVLTGLVFVQARQGHSLFRFDSIYAWGIALVSLCLVAIISRVAVLRIPQGRAREMAGL